MYLRLRQECRPDRGEQCAFGGFPEIAGNYRFLVSRNLETRRQKEPFHGPGGSHIEQSGGLEQRLPPPLALEEIVEAGVTLLAVIIGSQ